MAGFSKLLGNAMACQSWKSGASLLFRTPNKSAAANQLLTQTRGSHGRTMFIRPGMFYTKKYFDLIHFYVVIAGLPFALVLGYQHLFVGPATLTEIPDGYEPRHWEYYKHPFKRFLGKYFFKVPEQSYEITLNELYNEACKRKMRLLETKVRNMMQEKQDYKAWYYVPVSTTSFEAKQKLHDDFELTAIDTRFTK